MPSAEAPITTPRPTANGSPAVGCISFSRSVIRDDPRPTLAVRVRNKRPADTFCVVGPTLTRRHVVKDREEASRRANMAKHCVRRSSSRKQTTADGGRWVRGTRTAAAAGRRSTRLLFEEQDKRGRNECRVGDTVADGRMRRLAVQRLEVVVVGRRVDVSLVHEMIDGRLDRLCRQRLEAALQISQ